MNPRIRPIALCLFRWHNHILVSEDYDSVKQQAFCRPLGGGVEFGEYSREAIIREIQEELGARITDVKLIGVLESLFQLEGQQGHEIVFVYDARFEEETLYQQQTLVGVEGNTAFTARWYSLQELAQGSPRLVPEALWSLLG